jgi:hypothetical protein
MGLYFSDSLRTALLKKRALETEDPSMVYRDRYEAFRPSSRGSTQVTAPDRSTPRVWTTNLPGCVYEITELFRLVHEGASVSLDSSVVCVTG